MTKSDNHSNDEQVTDALRDTWVKLEQTYAVNPVPLHDWVALVTEQRSVMRKKLWRDLLVLWAVAVPFLFGFLMLAADLSPWFWPLQVVFLLAGIPLVVSEFRGKQRKEDAAHE